MPSRSRPVFVFLTSLEFILAVSLVAGLRLEPLPASASEQEITQEPAAAPGNAPGETLYVIALDKDGRPITDLKQEEVRIFEEKVEQKVTSIESATDEPLTVGLFFDISGSRHADRFIQEEAKLTSQFVHTIWKEGDTGFVVAFNDRTYAVTQPSHKLEDIDVGLSKIPDARYYGSTALYDALCVVKADKLNGIPGRRVYVALSDFEDNSSRNNLENVIQLAHAAKIAIFPVILSEGFGGGYSKRAEKRGKQTAQEVADKTGGVSLIPESHKELGPALEGLARAVVATYRISYSPSSQSADRRKKKLHIDTTRPHVKMLFSKD